MGSSPHHSLVLVYVEWIYWGVGLCDGRNAPEREREREREEVDAGFCRQTPNERGRHSLSLWSVRVRAAHNFRVSVSSLEQFRGEWLYRCDATRRDDAERPQSFRRGKPHRYVARL